MCTGEKRDVFTVSSKKGLDIMANTLKSQIHRIKVDIYMPCYSSQPVDPCEKWWTGKRFLADKWVSEVESLAVITLKCVIMRCPFINRKKLQYCTLQTETVTFSRLFSVQQLWSLWIIKSYMHWVSINSLTVKDLGCESKGCKLDLK